MNEPRLGAMTFAWRAAGLAMSALREGRLPLSPRRWAIDLQHLYGLMTAEQGTNGPRRARAKSIGLEQVRACISQAAAAELRAFLVSGSPLALPHHPSPDISVLLVLFNRAELTFRCFRSLAACTVPLEIVLVDNASSDDTARLLDRIRHAAVIRYPTNAGFGAAVNAGARAARGRHLLLLNNDTELLPGSLEAALHTIEASPDIGAVGGRLILPDGRLQEAGSIVWRDGSCEGYGRGDSPDAPAYLFQRDVDLCSAAFLLTPRRLFLDLGGFDPAFDPAYYEDADYCVRLWKAGHRVVYQPRATVMHYEFGSSASRFGAARLQLEKRDVFVRKHHAWLERQLPPTGDNVLRARQRTHAGKRVLVFDDRVPHYDLGSGFPRAAEMVRQLCALGHLVTVYPLSEPQEPWDAVYRDLPRTAEVVTDLGLGGVAQFMQARRGHYDVIIVSRHHNVQRLRSRLGPFDRWGARVVFDAEAISALRDLGYRRLLGETIDDQVASRQIREEVELARGADTVLTVSRLDEQLYTDAGITNVVVARHAVEPAPTPRAHADRAGILFVGAFAMLSPNADAVLWFAREVRPRLQAMLGGPVHMTISGLDPPAEVEALGDASTTVVRRAMDLAALHDRARIFVAPTRFAAGIPLKIIHAAAYGVPVVCTSLLARQLGWRPGIELLVGDTPEAFAEQCVRVYTDPDLWDRVRACALARVESEYRPEVFRAALRDALTSAVVPQPRVFAGAR